MAPEGSRKAPKKSAAVFILLPEQPICRL